MPSQPEDEADPSKDQESRDSASTLQSPHNLFVLGYFSSLREAQGVLEVQLPASLLKILHLERLTLVNSHFVSKEMVEFQTDLLFRIPRSDRDGEVVYVYILWEHQRKRDSLMVLRMWIYLGMIYQRLINEGSLPSGAKLPFVYPIVLYQGTEGWEKGLALEDLIDLDGIAPELHRWVPQFEIDLIRLDQDSPRIRPNDQLAGLGLSLMQAVMFRKVSAWLEEHIEELNQIFHEHRSLVRLILDYALRSGAGLTNQDFQRIIEEKGDSNMRYEAGSVAEELVAKGKAEGKTEGKTEGKIEGKTETKKEVALRLIKKGMSNEDISEITDLPLNTVAELRMEQG